MKQVFLFFCLIQFSFFFPQSGCAWGDRVVSISASWSFTPPTNKKLAGFRLYKNGERVCVLSNPSKRTLDCQVKVKPSILSFTLTAYFSDGRESPHSAPFLVDLSKNIHMMPILNLLLLDD